MTNNKTSELLQDSFIKIFKKYKGTYSQNDVEKIVEEALADQRQQLISKFEGMRVDYCPSCLNDDNANNWCDDFREQKSRNETIDDVLTLLAKEEE